MQNTKTVLTIYFIFSSFFGLLNCQKNESASKKKSDPKQSFSSQNKKIENKITDIYYFNKVSKGQLFPLETSIDEINKIFINTTIIIGEKTLQLSNCSIEVIKGQKKSVSYLNGKDNIELYNKVLAEFNLKINDKLSYIENLYPENKCNLPSETYIKVNENDLFFIYKGHIILYSKIPLENTVPKSKIFFEDKKGDMENGFISSYIIDEDIDKSYSVFIKEIPINEIKYLKKIKPVNNIKYTIDDVQISYINKNDILYINLLFPGGETEIIFSSIKKEKTNIIMKNFPQ